MSVEQGDLGLLSAIGVKVGFKQRDMRFSFLIKYIQDSELGDMKFFIDKFLRTGFLDV